MQIVKSHFVLLHHRHLYWISIKISNLNICHANWNNEIMKRWDRRKIDWQKYNDSINDNGKIICQSQATRAKVSTAVGICEESYMANIWFTHSHSPRIHSYTDSYPYTTSSVLRWRIMQLLLENCHWVDAKALIGALLPKSKFYVSVTHSTCLRRLSFTGMSV